MTICGNHYQWLIVLYEACISSSLGRCSWFSKEEDVRVTIFPTPTNAESQRNNFVGFFFFFWKKKERKQLDNLDLNKTFAKKKKKTLTNHLNVFDKSKQEILRFTEKGTFKTKTFRIWFFTMSGLWCAWRTQELLPGMSYVLEPWRLHRAQLYCSAILIQPVIRYYVLLPEWQRKWDGAWTLSPG